MLCGLSRKASLAEPRFATDKELTPLDGSRQQRPQLPTGNRAQCRLPTHAAIDRELDRQSSLYAGSHGVLLDGKGKTQRARSSCRHDENVMHIAVIGAGVIGLSATRRLLECGHTVRCYDATPGAGASVGDGRIFRLAHGTGELVALAQHANALWAQWGRAMGQPPIMNTGLLVAGALVADQYGTAMREAGSPGQCMGARQGQNRLPWVRIDKECLWDGHGGAIDAAAVMQWLLIETAAARVEQEAILTAADDQSLVVNGARYDRVLICAGASTVKLAASLGLALPDHHVRHMRRVWRVPAGWWPSFIDEQAALDAYGVSVADGVFAMGVGWDDPTCTNRWSDRRLVAFESQRNDEYRRRAAPKAAPTDQHILCTNNHWPFPGGRQFAVWQAKDVVVFGGNALFKFAPLLGRDLASIVTGGSVPRYLAPVAWPEIHPLHQTRVILAEPTASARGLGGQDSRLANA